MISIAKFPYRETGALIRSLKFLSPEIALYLQKYTILLCMEYCFHVWAVALSSPKIVLLSASPLKMTENASYFILKLFSFSSNLNCLDFLVMWKKQLDQKDKVNFKIHVITAWLAIDLFVAQCLTR